MGEEHSHLLTTGPSATWTNKPSCSHNPCHFLLLFFLFAGAALSPPLPTHILPSAVVETTNPDDDSEVERMNGGDSDTPDVGGAAALIVTLNLMSIILIIHSPMSKRDSTTFCL